MDKHTLINYIIGFGSVILSIAFYIWSKKKKTPTFEISGTTIISEDLKEKVSAIHITYDDLEIKNLTITKIAIWNSGNATIFRKDIPQTNQFRAEIDKAERFFDFAVLHKDDDSNLSLTQRGNVMYCDFDFIEPKSGFVIKIVHSGKSSEVINVLGKVIGGQNMTRINDFSRNLPQKEKDSEWTKYAVILIFGALLFYTFESEMLTMFKVMFSITCIIIIAAGLTQSMQKKVPKKLSSTFYQE